MQVGSRISVRPDYARGYITWESSSDGPTARVDAAGTDGGFVLHASGTCDWEIDGGDLTSSIEVAEGDVHYLAFGDAPTDREQCIDAHCRTIDFWRTWSESTDYEGRWREAVERSALTLKLLTHEPSGGIIAAATTSLPEVLGGERNWDYRYVWIRDAAFTVYAFIRLGHLAEAHAFTDWLLARLDGCDDSDTPPLSPLYDLDGNSDIAEIELDHWDGYADSRPVRVGNAASEQLQLDIYGELIDALYLADKYGEGLSIDAWRHVTIIID